MIIKMLVENTSNCESLDCEHGLSIYIETKKHKILFDTGASDLFAKNAKKMDIDLSQVDIVVISHGHYDHGGGLKTFLDINSTAKIYLHNKAFGNHYANRQNGEKEYIGLDKSLLKSNRFIFVNNNHVIDNELELFSNVAGNSPRPAGNNKLLVQIADSFAQDDFTHEQNLIINEGDKYIILAGCAHSGIVNIIEHFSREKNCFPNYVIGGFHMHTRLSTKCSNPNIVNEIGKRLLSTKAMYYTCHCTGIPCYKQLKMVMTENIKYLSTGDEIII